MELRHLRYFNTVVEAGSFTAAAGLLHVSQPPLSVAIAQLEAELGVQLLVRTPRGVEPTSAGRYLLDAASRVLGEVDDIAQTIGRFGSGAAGALTIAAVPALMWHRVPWLLRAYARDLPGVELRVVDPPPWAAIELLQQRGADLAAILVADADRFVQRHRSTLDIVDWGAVPLVAALPPDETTAPSPLPISSFESRELVIPRRTSAVPSLPEAVEAALGESRVTPSSFRTVETIQTSVPLIEAGLVRGILPDPDGRSLARFDLVLRRLEPEPEPLRALVLARKAGSRGAVTERLLDWISAHPVPPAT
ncbi:LysR family transcriptional regulator [Herbiconiux moechotypicola]|uniref:LysR substrate-binding domain-containing protein n=1 Tax=Herbiconiux moechotypicola TaxID=637393 RepID=A0ABN3DF71_9MICO|nr:LysR family transcriptional regulator [Herbiconiux moechotypicola]MCS5729363.1 LysR family transcriptional regulator [Herbiconiux moechotypicola]